MYPVLRMCYLEGKHRAWMDDFEELPITSSAGFSFNSINPARRHGERRCHSLIRLSLLVFGRCRCVQLIHILNVMLAIRKTM